MLALLVCVSLELVLEHHGLIWAIEDVGSRLERRKLG
jgi:hypothetical protein